MRPGCSALHRPLHELFGDALTGEGRIFAGDGARHGRGGWVDCQIEAASELHAAQDAQRVLRKGVAGGAQDAVVEIHLAAEEIPDFAGDGVEAHGVDGEVAAGGGFARGDGFVKVGVKIAVAGAGLAVAAGDAEVPYMRPGPGKLHHAEAFPDQIHAAAAGQERGQMIVRHAVDFDVEVLGLEAEQGVAHRASHHHGLESGRAQIADNLFQREW